MRRHSFSAWLRRPSLRAAARLWLGVVLGLGALAGPEPGRALADGGAAQLGGAPRGGKAAVAAPAPVPAPVPASTVAPDAAPDGVLDSAPDSARIMAAHPDLFDPRSGYRIARQHAPTPTDIPPPARVVDADEARALIAAGAVAIDVFGASRARYDALDGMWLVSKPHLSLPGATWLPETGRGAPEPEIERYLRENLERLTGGDRDRPVVVFCVADCWMSWNAAQRIARMGWRRVRWFRLGVDGWRERGWPLEPVSPPPVNVD